ncbi:TonB-dependent receptor [Sphingomonas sp. S2-65]|uniref:TonB-dependent receptor n=1 Tax=Sphingomonas sp. S2-65 TaxID=2903960 RepID=UPI001F2320A7|nr:TonB-dependent receptor [Sphingomonas sp. S2-65]UYY58135.1 TonB-dependent receptor [Sphingomonas sp. S2-65]
MNRSQSAGRANAPAFLALACVGFVASAPAAAAPDPTTDQAQSQTAREQDREDVIITGEAYQPHQETPKATRPVRDTPQTITVITAETIEQQNLLTLRDMLSTVPGITFGAAEGGTPPSDQINFRGFSASSDITQDGVRDSAAYSRSDSFNLEQLEIVNGANSVQNGAGSAGGSINIVTKRPLGDTRVTVTGGVGTPEYYRGTIDANLRASELIAVRLNAMVHRNDVPGRDVEYNKRWGVAPSVAIGIDGPTKLTLQYLHQEDRNIPQYGIPYFQNDLYDGMIPGVDRENYYGYRNVDRQDIDVDQATMIFDHEISDTVSVRNLARWQQVSQLTTVGPPQGTYCLDNDRTPTGGSCVVDLDTRTGPGQVLNITVPAGYYLIGGPRGNLRNSKNELMYDQLDLRATFNTGAIEHTATLGGSVSWEKYTLRSGNALRDAGGGNPYAFNPAAPSANQHYPYINIANPYEVVQGPALPGAVYGSNTYTGPINYTYTGRQVGEVTNYAVYLFDTMRLGKVELNAGLRWESNHGSNLSAVGATRLYNDNDLLSYRVGLVYKPVEAVSLYAAYGNSKTPSQSAVNGSCTVAGVNGATATTCITTPESAKNYEIGAKAELANGRLLLTASVFRNERDSYRVASNEPGIPDQQMDGHSRVDGIAIGAVGRITNAWSITANYTYLDGKLIQSVSNFCLNNPGAANCGNSVAFPDPGAGARLQNTPEHSGSLFTTYKLPFGLSIGYGLTYQGAIAFNLPTATARTVYEADDYLVHNAYLAYDFSKTLSAQLNVKNIGDELYFTRIRNNGWATPGDARSAVLTINYRF